MRPSGPELHVFPQRKPGVQVRLVTHPQRRHAGRIPPDSAAGGVVPAIRVAREPETVEVQMDRQIVRRRDLEINDRILAVLEGEGVRESLIVVAEREERIKRIPSSVRRMTVAAGVVVFHPQTRLPSDVEGISQRGDIGVRPDLVGGRMTRLAHGFQRVIEAKVLPLHSRADRAVDEVSGRAQLARRRAVPEGRCWLQRR